MLLQCPIYKIPLQLAACNLSLRHEDFDGMPGQYLQKPLGRGDFTTQGI